MPKIIKQGVERMIAFFNNITSFLFLEEKEL
jgi:hypothetical protein